ncbi:MAG: class I SAM-dependent methyltransferase, partial [Zetaproteobacteria bacterium]
MGSSNEARLCARIRAEIEREGGWISFARFMALALYAEGLGYYEAHAPFGDAGDFITAPRLGRLFALAVADLLAWAHEALPGDAPLAIVEQGAADGALIVPLAQIFKERGLDARWIAIERSAQLREALRRRADNAGLSVEVYPNEAALPAIPRGVWLSNELVDAFPV